MKKITEADYIESAKLLGVDIATIKTVYQVESNRSGFLESGEPTILFEGHKMWEQLVNAGKNPHNYVKGNENVLYPKWTKAHYKGGQAEHLRLQKAEKINKDFARMSASWGAFQIMGFNYKLSGFDTLQAFINAMYSSEGEQLKAFVNFCKNYKVKGVSLQTYLQRKDWESFAKFYNGSGYKLNQYDTKLKNAYAKFSK